ncbi:dihydroorotate dehydrogenase (quinone)-like isoform X2 [Daktulosphaira vitifoliae]|nr:dihydroorotate dehydrogenase (quinone)-like isoform X2 [Daktulosphaira vitifoliae]XP_050528571.1 dihydroorotate dehydrogenase (quinone)-like isoform X2 [Daktulosphaira vitifoliae]
MMLKSIFKVTSGGMLLFVGSNLLSLNETFYKKYIIPTIFLLEPENAHNFVIFTGKYGLIPKSFYQDPTSLKTTLWNINFKNPIGLAAGLDKQGEAIKSMHNVGFGFVEIGSVTPFPQPGNELPRVFRIINKDAVINRYGFNSDGHDAVYERIVKQKKDDFVIGVNLGKNKNSEDAKTDYVKGIEKFSSVADYFVINISSPNTPGLRNLQKKDDLKNLLSSVIEARNKNCKKHKLTPLLLKISPDLSDQDKKDIAGVILDEKCRVDGLIISNTTVERDGVCDCPNGLEPGGLSGRPLKDKSTKLISDFYKLTNGKIPIIGVGGIFNGQDAYEKVRAGASLLQIYTSFIYNGPPIITKIKKELETLLRENNYKSISEAVGVDSK